MTNQTNKNPNQNPIKNLKIREPYQKIILNLSKNIDIASEQWAKTGDAGYAWQYERLKSELCELKEFIKEKEAKTFGVPESFLNRN